jgi:hypothetical protein
VSATVEASDDARWLRFATAAVWFLTGALVLHPTYRAFGHEALARLGLPDALMWLACAGEVALAAVVALRPSHRLLALAQTGAVVFFTLVLAASQPMLLASPYGVLMKNIPFIAAVWGAWLLEREGWTSRAAWVLRVGMAAPWLTEGLVPKLLLQQDEELAIVAQSGFAFGAPGRTLAVLGVVELVSGLLALTLPRGRALTFVWLAHAAALVVLPLWVGALAPFLWLHPFGPLTKNLPILAGTVMLARRCSSSS